MFQQLHKILKVASVDKIVDKDGNYNFHAMTVACDTLKYIPEEVD